MADFSYEIPPSEKFLYALKKMFKRSGNKNVSSILDKCHTMEITTTSTFVHGRWNVREAYANFRTDYDTIDKIDPQIERILLEKCNVLMPDDSGYFFVSIDFSPSIDDFNEEETTEEYIDSLTDVADNNGAAFLKKFFDTDLIERGRELSGIYQILFIVENSLRNFIEQVLISDIGEDYFEKIALSKDIKIGISRRKNQEKSNKWLRIRGDSEIFYLDFIELAFIIKNNWKHFKDYFPDQAWIQVKIDEMYKVRCLIAHNSDIDDHEINVIKTNYKSILLQIASSVEMVDDDDLPF